MKTPAMSKGHFQMIADTIRFYEFSDPRDRINLAHEFAGRLAGTNPLFDKQRFIAAALKPVETPDYLKPLMEAK